jgi:hypothetical protein
VTGAEKLWHYVSYGADKVKKKPKKAAKANIHRVLSAKEAVKPKAHKEPVIKTP